jgi:serine/threonine protein kinase/cytochrome c-type biogenesis protein CcmH/NrfG
VQTSIERKLTTLLGPLESMPGDHWAAVEDLFYAALDVDPSARMRVLDAQRSKAPEVVADVESLLAHAEGTTFLQTAGLIRRTQWTAHPPGEPRVADRDTELQRVGRAIGHYRLTAFLGAGGMGAVFRATDLALGREAALKLLRRGLPTSERAVLLREADACARLQHPGIATFFEAGEADAETFIAMEYVAGEPLRRRLARGSLTLDEALSVGRGILEALGHAHAAGLVHRDIKPENVIITASGATKLLDFGIAKRLLNVTTADDERPGATWPSHHSTLVGTPGYLAPEQVLGQPVDARTDLFQVGLLLLEMLSERRTLPRMLFGQLAAAITTTPDVDVLRRSGVPDDLIAILRRATAPEPSARYPNAAAFLADLEHVNRTVTALPPTLAVIDFGAGRHEDVWLGSGLAERLAANLKRASGLRVIAREKVLRALRAEDASIEASDPVRVGQLVGCRWVLSGHVNRHDEALEIAMTLNDVTVGEVIGRTSVTGALSSLGDLEARITREILRALDVDGPATPPRAGSGDVEAFECFARARRLFHRLEKGTMQQAREFYERAIALDPGHAWALSGLAAFHAMRYPHQTDPEDLTHAADYARRAIAIDPTAGEPYTWLGYALMRLERKEEALQVLETAESLDPDSAYSPYFAGCTHIFLGRPEDAAPPLQRAIAIDGSHGFAWMILANVHMAVGDLTSARWCLERAIALERAGGPNATVAAAVYMGEILRLEGRTDDARSTCLAAIETAERSDHMYRDTFRGIGLCCLARTAFDQGDVEAARVALTQVLAHVHGRDRMLGGGHLAVQALAGLARAGEGVARFDEANQLFTHRTAFNFSTVAACDNATSLCALARAALTLELPQGPDLARRAIEAGAYEARLRFQLPL